MPATHQVRLCESCGLRYPIQAEHNFGIRCPVCMGNTRTILSRSLVADPQPDRPPINIPTRAVLLDNIRSAWNVGSIFRSADGFGFKHAYLCGITPTPQDDSISKTALGAEKTIPWSYHKDAVRLIEQTRTENWKIFALEEDPRAVDISLHRSTSPNHNQPRIIILGNEISGVDPGLLDLCDEIYYIPMYGNKKSFNVAMAFSIAAYILQN